ncbi:hypothetical protein BJY04DRAFT_200180 [Aspergillus karnatakaensis]|uniref:uncharacterized protein n=1 Tax=Aspergillus karnatakaensis TaxID=1810916 RepID=UPI003CCDAC99
MSSRRRNGQPASCEPCRKDKVRCDHGLPVCARCQKRDTASRCYYHPAPLTQGGSLSLSRSKFRRPSVPAKQRTQSEAQRLVSLTPSSIETPIQSPRTDQSLPQVYFGPTSFVSAFADGLETASSPSNRTSQPSCDGNYVLPPYWVSETSKVLALLTEYTTIEQLVLSFYEVTQAANVPTFFINKFVAGMQGIIEQGETTDSLHQKTTEILKKTAPRFQVPSDIKAKDFHKLVTRSELRLEIIGIVLSIAARASFFGFASDRFPGSAKASSAARIDFARVMLAASETVIQVCKMLTPVNDLMVWLLYENWIVACMVDGDSSSSRWHRVGELSNYVFELGLHRDRQDDGIATFLREIRRRSYAGLYHADKNIATFFGRPPRVSWRYSDTKPPLDISEDAMLGDEEELERALNNLDSGGWSVDAAFHRASWYRLRFFMGKIREQILELSVGPPGPESAKKLRETAVRCTETWEAIPSHLRYSPERFSDDLPLPIRLMLLQVYFQYLYSMFLIQRLLAQHDPAAEPELIDISSQILSIVLLVGRQQEPNIDVQRDFNTVIVLYGFSSASVLLKALQAQVRTCQSVSYTVSRAELIRNLSVFVSQLEPMARPSASNINHTLFDRASKMFTAILDEVLESPLPVSSSTSGAQDVGFGVETGSLVTVGEDWNSSWAADGMDFLDTLNFDLVFDQWVF